VTIDDDGLYTLQDRTVQRVDPNTGTSRWAATAGGGKRAGANDGLVATTDEHVAAGGAGGVIVFGKESGQQTAQLTEEYGDPVRAWNGQFVVAGDSAVTAYDPDGTAQWTVEGVSLNWLTPVVGSTVVGGGSGTFVGIDLDSGTQAWTTEPSGEFRYAKTAATDETVFVYPDWATVDTFYALNADTGAVRWEEGGIDSTAFPPVVLKSGIVLPDGIGVQANDPKTGEQLASTANDDFWLGFYKGVAASGRTIINYSERAYAYRL